MAIPTLSGSYIDQTYQRLVQTDSTRTQFADGLGNPISFGTTTVPGGPNTSLQFNDNATFSGSTNLTFDKSKNSLTLTGSFNVSGSAIQIGNNNLYGNTTLSGSIVISGSTTVPATPTIKVYGDMETNGVIKFLSVNKNIDTTISGSYIYVSGSTNDLYFSQNGAGFNNNVRLRWIEGGALYTGLLRGGIISSTPGTTTFNITSGSGLLVTMNASTASEPYPTVQYISWPNFTAQPITYSGSAKITYVGIDSNGQIIQQTVPWGSNDINQWDNSLSLGVVLHLSGSVSTGVFNAPQISYGGQQKTDDFFRAFGPLKISGHTLQASGSTLGLQKTGGTSYREGANYVINANHPSTVIENAISTSKIYRYYLSGSTPIIDTGVGNAGYTTIDPTKYVDTTTGQLVTVSGNNSNQWRWTIQRVFWVPNSPTNAFIVYYGNAEYTTLVDVKNAIDTEPFSEAPNTSQNAIFIGYILVRKGCTDLSDTTGTNAVLVQGGLFRNIGGNGGSGTAAATSLGSLSDVTITSPTNGQPLVYNSSISKWINSNSITGSLQGTASYVSTLRAAGSNTQIQYNSASILAADSSFTYDYNKKSIALGSLNTSGAPYSLTMGEYCATFGSGSMAFGFDSAVALSGPYSLAQGQLTYCAGVASHAEGNGTYAYSDYSHAEGTTVTVTGIAAHAEGYATFARGYASHAEGYNVIASGSYSHAEGGGTSAFGEASHAEGAATLASGLASHAEGLYTVALGDYQHVQGRYNISSSAQSAFIIGNGADNTNRSNLLFASGSQVEITGSLIITKHLEVDSGSIVPYYTVSGIDLYAAAYDITGSGIFEITNAGAPSPFLLSFPDPSVHNGQTIFVVNTDNNNNALIDNTNTYAPYNRGTNTQLSAIGVEEMYHFISIGGKWRGMLAAR